MIVSFWLVWAIFALHSYCPLAKSTAGPPPDTVEEGSGYDAIDLYYDAEDDDDVSLYDNYDGGGDYWDFEDNIVTPIPKSEEQVLMNCFHCLGDGSTGCDVVTMLKNIDMHTIPCHGRCLNVSSGSTSVYDCARDLKAENDNCFVNGDTRLCFCSGDQCNGPNPAILIMAVFKPFLLHSTPPPKIPKDLVNFTASLETIIANASHVIANLSDVINSSDIPLYNDLWPSDEIADDSRQFVNQEGEEGEESQVVLPSFMREEIDIIIPMDGATSATDGNSSSLASFIDLDSNQAERIQSFSVASSRERNSAPLLSNRKCLYTNSITSLVFIYFTVYVRIWL